MPEFARIPMVARSGIGWYSSAFRAGLAVRLGFAQARSESSQLMSDTLDFIESVARGAGEILASIHGTLTAAEIDFKARRDMKTRADTESENYVVARIRDRFPSDSIYAEEGDPIINSPRRWWFIDPLDGTTNFAHGVPFYNVSIGLWEDGRVRYGAVFAPSMQEMFVAEYGRGARLNGHPLRASGISEMDKALLATGFPYSRNEIENNNLPAFNHFCLRAQCMRRLGAAALDLAYVAAGRLDAYWEMFLGPWDCAAGALMVHEAGGTVTDFAGGSDWLFGENVVASNGKLHDQMLQGVGTPDPRCGTRYRRPVME